MALSRLFDGSNEDVAVCCLHHLNATDLTRAGLCNRYWASLVKDSVTWMESSFSWNLDRNQALTCRLQFEQQHQQQNHDDVEEFHRGMLYRMYALFPFGHHMYAQLRKLHIHEYMASLNLLGQFKHLSVLRITRLNFVNQAFLSRHQHPTQVFLRDLKRLNKLRTLEIGSFQQSLPDLYYEGDSTEEKSTWMSTIPLSTSSLNDLNICCPWCANFLFATRFSKMELTNLESLCFMGTCENLQALGQVEGLSVRSLGIDVERLTRFRWTLDWCRVPVNYDTMGPDGFFQRFISDYFEDFNQGNRRIKQNNNIEVLELGVVEYFRAIKLPIGLSPLFPKLKSIWLSSCFQAAHQRAEWKPNDDVAYFQYRFLDCGECNAFTELEKCVLCLQNRNWVFNRIIDNDEQQQCETTKTMDLCRAKRQKIQTKSSLWQLI